jgi:hypothetical protein
LRSYGCNYLFFWANYFNHDVMIMHDRNSRNDYLIQASSTALGTLSKSSIWGLHVAVIEARTSARQYAWSALWGSSCRFSS